MLGWSAWLQEHAASAVILCSEGSALAILKLLIIFDQEPPAFHLASGCANYVVKVHSICFTWIILFYPSKSPGR